MRAMRAARSAARRIGLAPGDADRAPRPDAARKEPALLYLLLLAAGAAAVGSFIVWEFGSSRLGDPNVCEGLGWGCSPSQLTETLEVIVVLWALLLAAAVVARLAVRHRLPVLAAGMVVAGIGTFAKWNAEIIRYSVPALTAEQARAEMEHLLAGLADAAGPGDPSHVPAGVKAKVASPPSPAAVLRSIEPEPPVPCLDRGGDRPTGSFMLVWSRSTAVLVPLTSLGPPPPGIRPATLIVPGSLPTEHVEQIKRVTRALRAAGFEPMESSGPSLEEVRATREGPAVAEQREGKVSTTYRVHIGTSLGREPEGDSAEVTATAHIETPCFRR